MTKRKEAEIDFCSRITKHCSPLQQIKTLSRDCCEFEQVWF